MRQHLQVSDENTAAAWHQTVTDMKLTPHSFARAGCTGPTNWDCHHCVNYKVYNDTKYDYLPVAQNTTGNLTAGSVTLKVILMTTPTTTTTAATTSKVTTTEVPEGDLSSSNETELLLTLDGEFLDPKASVSANLTASLWLLSG